MRTRMRQRKLISIDPAAVMRAGAIRVVVTVRTPRRVVQTICAGRGLNPSQKGNRDVATQQSTQQ
jgi:hypothetical protein